MKLHLRLLAVLLSAFMACAYAAPDRTQGENRAGTEASDDPIAKFSSPGEEAVGDLLLQAMSLLGVAYRFGGSTPNSGLDCSGFIQYVFQKSLKVNLPRTAAEMARVGKPVDKGELVPGDLVFFNTRGFAYSHVGIYMGNGRFIHSPRTGKSVEITSLNGSYWVQRYNGARRVQRGSANLAHELTDKKPEKVARSPEPRKVEAKADEAKPASRYRKVDAAEEPAVKCRKGRHCPAVKADVAESPRGKKKSPRDDAEQPAHRGGKKKKSAEDDGDKKKGHGTKKHAKDAGDEEPRKKSRHHTRRD